MLSENCSSSCTGSKNDSNKTQKRDKKTKSASSGRQCLPDDGKTNFIERNIEVVTGMLRLKYQKFSLPAFHLLANILFDL